MRCSQFVGLTLDAIHFKSQLEKVRESELITGMFEEPLHLPYEYKDKEGKLWKEEVQHERWSSGLMLFTCLKCEDGRVIGWFEDERARGIGYDADKGIFWV